MSTKIRYINRHNRFKQPDEDDLNWEPGLVITSKKTGRILTNSNSTQSQTHNSSINAAIEHSKVKRKSKLKSKSNVNGNGNKDELPYIKALTLSPSELYKLTCNQRFVKDHPSISEERMKSHVIYCLKNGITMRPTNATVRILAEQGLFPYIIAQTLIIDRTSLYKFFPRKASLHAGKNAYLANNVMPSIKRHIKTSPAAALHQLEKHTAREQWENEDAINDKPKTLTELFQEIGHARNKG